MKRIFFMQPMLGIGFIFFATSLLIDNRLSATNPCDLIKNAINLAYQDSKQQEAFDIAADSSGLEDDDYGFVPGYDLDLHDGIVVPLWNKAKNTVTSIDWKQVCLAARNKIMDLGKEGGLIDKTYKSIRHRYWYSSVILPEEREFNNVFLFERTDEELSWLTTDGYNFVVPAAVVQGGFFTAIRGGSLLFHDLVKTLNRIKINLNSRVLYFLLSARKLDLEHKLSYESQEAESHLFDVATRLNDKELFDALKICNIVTINEANILIPLHYAITAVLLGRYPLKKIVGMIELELDLSAAWGDPLDDYKKLMSISLRKLVGAVLNIDFYKHSQKHVEEATMQQVEPAGDSKKKKKEKKVSIARRIQPGRKVKDQPILV